MPHQSMMFDLVFHLLPIDIQTSSTHADILHHPARLAGQLLGIFDYILNILDLLLQI